MPAPAFLVFELGAVILALACLRHAWRAGRSRLASLLAGIGYGVLLEYAAIQSFHAYRYGQFLIMLGGVPLCIGLSWGIIIYTAMESSDRFRLPWYLRPLVDAMLALTIDLAMDAVAIRLGFWAWGAPGAWFGVPLGNFYAWLLVVAGFSLLVRLARRSALAGWRALTIDLALVGVAVPLAVLGLVPVLRPYLALLSQGRAAWLILGALLGGGGLFALWAALRARQSAPPDPLLLAVPLAFHGFFFGALLWAGIGRQIPALLAVSAAVLLLSLLLHGAAQLARLPA